MSGISFFPCALAFHPGEMFAGVPESPAVFLLRPADPKAEPYLSKTAHLRRRLHRLLGSESAPSRLGDLRAITAAIEFRPTASAFETAYWLYRAARELFPSRYRRMLRLRPPALIKVGLAKEYPRCWITRHISRGPGLYYGPFRSRAAAERFANDFLDLFKIRRCLGDIHPDPSFPGCIYSEMKMCLAPCFAGCTREEYEREVRRVTEFLSSDGQSLLVELATQRDAESQELHFEEAAQIHKKLDKVKEVLRSKEPLARELSHLHGVLVEPSTEDQYVELFAWTAGYLTPPFRFSLAPGPGSPVSLDSRLKEAFVGKQNPKGSGQELSEHLALVARWYYSSFRRGEIIVFSDWDRLPYRKIIHACSRVLAESKRGASILLSPG